MRRRSYARSITLTLLLIVTCACTRKADVVRRDSIATTTATTVPSTQDGGGTSEIAIQDPSASVFKVVRAKVRFTLRRVSKSPVLGVDEELGRAIYVLQNDGSMTIVEPFVRAVAETLSSGMQPNVVAGVWPETVFIEMYNPTARTEIDFAELSMNVARGVVKREQRHVAAASPWRDGSVLTNDAAGASHVLSMVPRATTFAVSPGTTSPSTSAPPPPPTIPNDAAMRTAHFIAYESGRIFLLGGKKSEKQSPPLDNYVWDFAANGAPATPVKMPGDVDQLIRGREERESLALGTSDVGGESFLVRFDGTSWKSVDRPFSGALRSISIGDDGSVWLIGDGKLWRGDFPNLASWSEVPLPKGYVPGDVMARDASDVWITSGDDPTREKTLLHSQSTEPSAASVAERPEPLETIYPKVAIKTDPTPYTRSCAIPFIVFGLADTDLTEDEARKLAKQITAKDLVGGSLVLGRIKGGRVYGYPSYSRKPDDIASVFAMVKQARHNAQLVCTQPIVEKEFERER